MQYPNLIEKLINYLSEFPGIGRKTAERIAFFILSAPDEYTSKFGDLLKNIKFSIKNCKICGNLSETEICSICNNPARDKTKICIVEDPRDVYIIENLKIYNGLYHILFGLISPLDGIGPEKLNINTLLNRIETSPVEEIIFALNPTAEGETTSLYISKLLKKEIKITKLAYGLPLGSNIRYADYVTLTRSFLNRETLK